MTSPMAAESHEADELEDASQRKRIAELAPPDDMLSLPPEPKMVDLVSPMLHACGLTLRNMLTS